MSISFKNPSGCCPTFGVHCKGAWLEENNNMQSPWMLSDVSALMVSQKWRGIK
jgi:hypothetical protein